MLPAVAVRAKQLHVGRTFVEQPTEVLVVTFGCASFASAAIGVFDIQERGFCSAAAITCSAIHGQDLESHRFEISLVASTLCCAKLCIFSPFAAAFGFFSVAAPCALLKSLLRGMATTLAAPISGDPVLA